jgi:hypothetical protein
VGQGRRPLALTAAGPIVYVAASSAASDRLGEIALAVATVVAVVAVGVALTGIARRNAGRTGLTSPLVVVTGGAAITFVAYIAFQIRCGDTGCVVGIGDTVAGISPWWRIDRAWQWGGQLTLASAGLMISSLALAFAARESRAARPLLIAARAAYFIWILLVFAVPLAWEVFVID